MLPFLIFLVIFSLVLFLLVFNARRFKRNLAERRAIKQEIATTREKQQTSKGEPLRSFHTNIAGINESNKDGIKRTDLIAKCYDGQKLHLVREKDNSHDPNAVAIYTLKGRQLGYLYREEASEIAPRLDKGSPVDAEIVKLDADEDLNITGCLIKLTKYKM